MRVTVLPPEDTAAVRDRHGYPASGTFNESPHRRPPLFKAMAGRPLTDPNHPEEEG